MKPVGGAVHLRHRTVRWPLVGWLAVGSVPSAFIGAVVIGKVGHAAVCRTTSRCSSGSRSVRRWR